MENDYDREVINVGDVVASTVGLAAVCADAERPPSLGGSTMVGEKDLLLVSLYGRAPEPPGVEQ